jgi:hypothetical protein
MNRSAHVCIPQQVSASHNEKDVIVGDRKDATIFFHVRKITINDFFGQVQKRS